MDSLIQLLNSSECSTADVPFGSFDEVVGLIEKEQVKSAVPIIEKTFSEGICDIRFVFYVYYANFLDKGVVSLQEICPLIISIASQHAHRLVPVNKQEIHLQNSLNWFFSKILSKLKQEDRISKSAKKQAVLEKSLSRLDGAAFDLFLKVMTDFREFFYKKWPDSPSKEKIAHLVKRIEDMRSLIAPEHAVAPAEVVKAIALDAEAPAPKKESVETADTNRQSVEMDSELMNALIKKMQVFESLIERKDYLKASLVAKDISYIIEHFDPCAYFPSLFSKYLALMTQHIAEIAHEWGQESSLRWDCLNKLYKTDIQQFVNL